MTRRQLFNDPDFQELVKLHVIYGEYSVEKLRAEHGRDLPTLKLYNEVTVGSKAPGLPTINTVQLVEGRVDIEADNGVVHVIDELLAQAPTATLLVESTAGRERLNSVRRMWRDADVDGLFSRNEYRFTFFLPEDSRRWPSSSRRATCAWWPCTVWRAALGRATTCTRGRSWAHCRAPRRTSPATTRATCTTRASASSTPTSPLTTAGFT